jgi:hypothetical protein
MLLPGSPQIERLLAEKRKNLAQNWSEPQIPQQPEGRTDFNTRWGAVPQQRSGEPLPLDAVRDSLRSRIAAFLNEPGDEKKVRVFAAPPGTGKTYAAVQAVQDIGKRAFWCAANHDGYDNLIIDAGADPRQWFHWLGMGQDDPDNPERKMCHHHTEMALWLEKGYPSYAFCKGVCPVQACPYRMQAANERPYVVGVHQHLPTYVSQPPPHVMIIDENPLSNGFIQHRIIPADGINLGGSGPVAELTRVLQIMAETCSTGERYAGPRLLMNIHRDLDDVYAQIEVNPDAQPAIPLIVSPSDVYDAPYYWLMDFLVRIDAEYMAYKNKWRDWEARVWINSEGLNIISRADLFADAPNRIAVLDATASIPLYERMFPEYDVSVERPEIARVANVYQIANRTNGKGALEEADEKSGDGLRQDVRIVKAIVKRRGYQNVGIITHKSAEKAYQDAGFETMHFYKTRGRNEFKKCDAVFVVGTPIPNFESLRQIHVVLSDDITPIRDENGEYPYYYAPKYYDLTPECIARHGGLRPYRNIGGYWREPFASLMQVHREHEMLQCAARIRPLLNDGDIWILSSIPTMELDEFYEDPGEAIGCPPGIYWQNWLDISDRLDQLEPGAVVTSDDLAKWTGKAKNTIYRGNWIDKIVDQDGWEAAAIKLDSRTGGRPKKGIRKMG